jgi:hypothetical protein
VCVQGKEPCYARDPREEVKEEVSALGHGRDLGYWKIFRFRLDQVCSILMPPSDGDLVLCCQRQQHNGEGVGASVRAAGRSSHCPS